MQLTYDATTEAFRSEFSAWLDAHVPDPSEMADRPTSSAGTPPWAREFQAKMFDDGWLVPAFPPEFGGRDAGLFEQMVYFQELGRRGITRSFNPQGLGIVSASIVSFGNDQQKQQYAIPIMRAEMMAALGMSEPGAGSDLASLKTKAVADGDVFVLNGQKVWTSGAHEADVILVFARTDPNVAKHKGISAFIVETDRPGITRRPFPDITGPDHLDLNEVFFDDVVVPASSLVGDLNDGWAICNGALAHERAMLWVMWSHSLDDMIGDVLDGVRSTPKADDPVLLDKLGKSIMDGEALRLLGYRQLAKQQRGLVPAEQSILKMMGSEAQRELALTVLESIPSMKPPRLDRSQPSSPTDELDGSNWFNRYLSTFAGTISGGTSEIQRNIIAERVLGLPRG